MEPNTQSDLEYFLSAKSIEDVWERLLERLQGFGFDNVLYGFSRFSTDNGFGRDEDTLVLTNLGDAYVDGYFREGRYVNAPIVQWASVNEGACAWDYVTKNFDSFSKETQKVAEFNFSYGLRYGYTVVLASNLKRYKGAIGMSLGPQATSQKEADEIWQAHGRSISLLCQVAHLKLLSLPFEAQRLTERQRQVLEWVGDGKTNSEIATIMSLTPATVEKHLKLARTTLGAENTAQAVLKATLLNQIHLA